MRIENESAIVSLFLMMALVLTVLWCVIRIPAAIEFDKNCGGYISRAENAGTIENAVSNMDVAIAYLKEHELTKGYTSVFYRTPNEDIEYWYRNICDSTESLRNLSPEATELEKSNMLMKLREVLTDGSSTTIPDGISIYPHNGIMMFLGLAMVFFLLMLFFLVAIFNINLVR